MSNNSNKYSKQNNYNPKININHNFNRGKKYNNIDGEQFIHPHLGGTGIVGVLILDATKSNNLMWTNRCHSQELAYSGHSHAHEPAPAIPVEYSVHNALNSIEQI